VSEQASLWEEPAAEWKGGIRHASRNGYPACGAEQRAVDIQSRFLGDIVVGEYMRQHGEAINCPACLALEAKP